MTARHLVLVGLMGSGKTTIGGMLAARLGRPFLDSDQLIEIATGRTVREIFATDGEPAFRALETAALVDALAAAEPTVIAAAGGVVLATENRRALLEADADVVWLHADLDLLAERAQRGDHRPLLDDDPAGTLRQMAADRMDLYAEVSTYRVDTAGRTPAQLADRILDLVGAEP